MIMKTIKLVCTLVLFACMTSCTKDFLQEESSKATDNQTSELKSKPQQLKIAVISDIHFMHPTLLQNGADYGLAFQTYLASDPKLIAFSGPIFATVLSDLLLEKPDIVLIPGDLTKDGEMVSHQAMAGLLGQLAAAGIKVYVIPGNHDINNPEAVAYDGNTASPVPSISADDFSTIYSSFGYGNALYRDPNSLSYICQPFGKLWILGIDDCKYYDNTTFATVSGVIKPGTMDWIQSKMQEARENNITVLAMMHHGMVEHYTGQNQLDPGYVTDNWEENAALLMNAGLRVIFTGHYHANDITLHSLPPLALYDIETGSLVTPPSPYRIITLFNNTIDINTRRVTSIEFPIPGGFVTYSQLFLTAHMDAIFNYILSNPPYYLPPELAAYAAPLFRNAMMAHYAGDEKISQSERAKDRILAAQVPVLGNALSGLWSDLRPQDNSLHVNIH